tara:strand:- start:21296 stop:21931 length:636 start_codon:yes stop_codon:yes gene_type:complete
MSNPESILEKLKNKANSERAVQSLEAIHAVCEDLKKSGHSDFTVATVARMGEGRGVPKAQSIRNASGEPYRVLIAAWQNSTSKGVVAKKRASALPNSYSWVDEIDDPRLRYLARDMAARMSEQKADLQRLKQVTQLQLDMRSSTPAAQPGTGLELTETEREALKQAIDPDFLEAQEWTIDSAGRIKNRSKRTLFQAGFVDALQKLTAIEGG